LFTIRYFFLSPVSGDVMLRCIGRAAVYMVLEPRVCLCSTSSKWIKLAGKKELKAPSQLLNEGSEECHETPPGL
jgi:hypothetical protein